MPKWRIYVPDYFEYMFIRRSNNTLLTAMKLHNALTVIAECPWPNTAGPRRWGNHPRVGGRSALIYGVYREIADFYGRAGAARGYRAKVPQQQPPASSTGP